MKFLFEIRIRPGHTAEQYADAWVRASEIIQRAPGARGTRLHRKIGEPDVLLAIAEWDTKASRDASQGALPEADAIIRAAAKFCDITILGEFEDPEWVVLPPAGARYSTGMPRSGSVSIRPYRPGDESGFHEAAIESVRELQPWMPWCHPGFALADAREWVERQIALFAAKTELEFVIVDESGRIAGGCGLNQIDESNRRANLGYWVRASAAGRGVATDAVRALAQWARAETELHRLELVIATGNAPSQRVAERAGAMRECVARDRLLLHDGFHDAVIYVFLRGENL